MHNEKTTIFIDGSSGTAGLRIYDRLAQREDIDLLTLPPELHHDIKAQRELINRADIAFLCLPDAAAITAADLVENPDTVVLDTSTAHRTAPGWVYGFPELSPEREAAIRTVSKRECLLQYQTMTQDEIDQCITHNVYLAPNNDKSKGICNETFRFVQTTVSKRKGSFTAADIATETGLSRITIRKYMELMRESGFLNSELEYGEVGRPQKRYSYTKNKQDA